MDNQVNFDLNEALKCYLSDPASISTPEANPALQECEHDPEAFSGGLANSVLNPIVDSIADNPENLFRSSIFDSLQFLLKCAPNFPFDVTLSTQGTSSELDELSRQVSQLPTLALSKLFDIVISGLSSEADAVHNELGNDEQDDNPQCKRLFEMYAFLLQWTIAVVEVRAAEKPTNVPTRGRGGKGIKSKVTVKDGIWDSAPQVQNALDVMCKVLKLRLNKVFMTTSERDTFVGLFTRAVNLIMESEQRMKSTPLRMYAFKVLCVAIKQHGHAFGG